MKVRCPAFSLVEVVLALGVVSFALLAILGAFPVGLQTGRGAHDETRAAQIAQGLFASIAAQAPTKFSSIAIPIDSNTTLPLDLTQSASPANPQLYADNSGRLSRTATNMAYAITITSNNAPAGVLAADAGLANQVTISVGWPAAASGVNRTQRSFVRIISRY